MSSFKNQQIHSSNRRVHISTVIHSFGLMELVVHVIITLLLVDTRSNMSPQPNHVQ